MQMKTKTFRQYLKEIKIPNEDAWPDFARKPMKRVDFMGRETSKMSDADVRKREEWHRKQYVIHAISGNQDKAKYHKEASDEAEAEIKNRSDKFLISLRKKA